MYVCVCVCILTQVSLFFELTYLVSHTSPLIAAGYVWVLYSTMGDHCTLYSRAVYGHCVCVCVCVEVLGV